MKNLAKFIESFSTVLVNTEMFGFRDDSLTGGYYPIELGFTLRQESKFYEPKDINGIPVRLYNSVGSQYNPTRVAAYGLAHYNQYISTGLEVSYQKFLLVADWFMVAKDGLWKYSFDWGELKSPWISAMSQGEGISVLTRAYALTKDDKYLSQSLKASRPFSVYISDGGVRSEIQNGVEFLEEYPLSQPLHTLNGFLYALVGILDLSAFYPSIVAETGFSRLLDTVASHWKWWDIGYWSAYDLHKSVRGFRNPATVPYHNLHISLMEYLGQVCNELQLLECARKWRIDAGLLSKRLRAFVGKTIYRIENRPQR